MLPVMPPWEDRDISDIENEPPFATYGWNPPLCPWCGQWLRPMDMRPLGLPLKAATACPFYHGMLAFSQRKWVDLRPPKVERGGDGAWSSTLTLDQIRAMICAF